MKLNKLTVSLLAVVMIFAFSAPVTAAGFGGGRGGAMGGTADGDRPYNDGEFLNPEGRPAGGGMGNRGGGFGRPGGMFLRSLVGELELTDDQRDQIDVILADYKDAMLTLVEEMGTVRPDLAEAIHSDVFDETGVRLASQAIAAIQEEMNVLRALVISDVRNVLTPEQLELLDEWRARKLERDQIRLESMGSRLDEWVEAEAQ